MYHTIEIMNTTVHLRIKLKWADKFEPLRQKSQKRVECILFFSIFINHEGTKARGS